jgi:hypothetical protein
MKLKGWLLIGLVLAIASGCAQRGDWIEDTLVTVDVAGRWAGKWSGGSAARAGESEGEFDMTVRQTGAKATGDVKVTGRDSHLWNGPIEGTVSGDRLKFSRPDGQLRGEVVVAGNNMYGTATFGGLTRRLRLHRQP